MNVVIVGGGNAGWLTALLFSKIASHHKYTVISSNDISTIGVGEGTTGKFVDILNRPILGINFNDMFERVNALPKLGIHFKNWSRKGDYYSPIEGTITKDYYIDYATYVADLYDIGHVASLSGNVMKHSLSNYRRDGLSIEQIFVGSALHLDTHKTTEYLKEKCISGGVKHIQETVEHVHVNEKIIDSIVLSDGSTVSADLFVDCSGFSRILSQHLTDWVSFEKYLPVNAALVYETEKEFNRNPYTTATAMKYGWTWDIPTRKRIGRGYVYCDQYTNENAVLRELKKHHGCDVHKHRTLNFTSGKSSDFLVGNCLTIGLSAAFLEPLQATSLHCTLVQADEFLYGFLLSDALENEECVRSYNARCHQLYDTTRDFVFLHYTGGKTTTKFWKYFRECDCPPNIQRILNVSKQRLVRSFDLDFCNFSGGTAHLWNTTIAGLGHYSKAIIETVLTHDHTQIEKYKKNLLEQEQQILNALPSFEDFLLSLDNPAHIC